MWVSQSALVTVVLILALIGCSSSVETNDCAAGQPNNCDVETIQSCADFQANFLNKKPGVLRASEDLAAALEEFQSLTTREALRQNELEIRLSTSVSYTGRVYTSTTVREYVLDESPVSALGNETFYLFGNHDGEGWKRFLSKYPRLENSRWFSCANFVLEEASLSFGCAKQGTGVPWHFHGPGFLQVLVGRKQWFLAAPSISNEQIGFDPNITTGEWYETKFLNHEKELSFIRSCTLEESDVIYFPPMWKHATYNTGTWNSWMSTFLK